MKKIELSQEELTHLWGLMSNDLRNVKDLVTEKMRQELHDKLLAKMSEKENVDNHKRKKSE